MSLLHKILNKRRSSEPSKVFTDAERDDSEKMTVTREEIESAVANAAQDSGPMRVWIEPATSHTKAQKLLERCEIDAQDLFIIGRRGFGKGRYDYTNSGYQLRDHEPYTVSKRHCAITLTKEGVLVEDLGSRFGTLVNGERLGVSKSNPTQVVLGRGEHALVIGRRNSQNCFSLIVE